jgi:hypothetical protein
MVLRGMNTDDLATEIGFRSGHVSNVLSGRGKSWRVQSSINRFFREKIFRRPPRVRRSATLHSLRSAIQSAKPK